MRFFGTGMMRSGTTSLASLLIFQEQGKILKDFPVHIPWNVQELDIIRRLKLYESPGYIGDVDWSLLNAIPSLVDIYPTAKFVCMKRDKSEWMDNPKLPRNPSLAPSGNPGEQYDTYYQKASELERTFPQFKIFVTEALNDPALILAFYEIKEPKIKIFHLNQSET